MKVDTKNNFRFSQWAPESGTLDTGNDEPEETETPILGISYSLIHTEFSNALNQFHEKHKQCSILESLLQQKNRSPELKFQLEEPLLREYKDNIFFLIDGLLYHIEKHTSSLIVIERYHICKMCP
ncbi:hypothetical protein O181_036024 [Austropuccinia psidii MF-1]|uniref:Uncharacterized protein n=1 Tax=Austropuccinia psidii MF-1 TaxID=1389203 RepID=A0A9Q3D3S6_9BASI|nr:hypothetical protein [Austropuccinia psidii MF-1]